MTMLFSFKLKKICGIIFCALTKSKLTSQRHLFQTHLNCNLKLMELQAHTF